MTGLDKTTMMNREANITNCNEDTKICMITLLFFKELCFGFSNCRRQWKGVTRNQTQQNKSPKKSHESTHSEQNANNDRKRQLTIRLANLQTVCNKLCKCNRASTTAFNDETRKSELYNNECAETHNNYFFSDLLDL